MEYAINDSKTTPPTSGWSLEMPVWKTGLYIWQRVKVTYNTGNPSYTTPHCLESNIIEDVTGNIGDWIFRDKTGVLSGTEIWTDKADDNAVVHVEVDGKSWQEGTPSSSNPSVIHSLNNFDVVSSVGKDNHPLADKINLLFDEPLRSRGNVCDRLINKNGIWVIERNIQLLYPEDGTRSIQATFGVRSNPLYENLSQEFQDKLNNLRTFKDSNYVYTVLPGRSNTVSENLKPTLHATFKSIAWANDFRYKFEQSKAMHSTDVWFAKSASNTTAPSSGWSTNAPVWEDGLYIWSKTITTYGDGRTEETSPVCITGATGRSVSKIEEWYYLSNKPDVLEGGTWSNTPPTWKDGKYIWTKNKIIYKNPSGTDETAPINSTGGSGQKGDAGADARTVRLNNAIHAVHFDQDGLMPSVTSILFSASVQGFSGVTPYYEFKMGSTVVRGSSTTSSWSLNTSTMKYSDFPLAVTVNVSVGGQTVATDTVTIVGTKPGEDAYTVVLANESHTFVGDVSNAIAGNTTANVIAYRGGTQIGATIGTISGLPTGMTSTIYSNGTTAARVTFTVTTSMTSPNGVVNIPVTVNGKSFTKVFNYAIAFKGAKGDKGTDGVAGKDGVGIKTTVLAYASSTSGTTTPTSGWTATVPTVAPGNYLWTRTTWNYSDNSSENGYTVSRIGKDGNTGANGVAGKDGVGIKSTVIHYGKSTSGTSYSGVTWTTAIPSVSNGQFLWTRTTWTYDDNTTETGYSVAKMGETGAKGDKGDKGDKGTDGIAGKDGVGLIGTNINYATSTSGTIRPNDWGNEVPVTQPGNYLWTKTTWDYSDNTSENGYSVSRIGKDGNNGTNGIAGKDGVGITKTTITYAKSSSGTTAPTTGYTTTVPSANPGEFVWTKTVWTYTDNTTETGYSVGKIGNTGATGATGATGKDGVAGKDGVGIKTTTLNYASSTSGTTTPTSGWQSTVPTVAAGNYLWTRTTWTYTDNSVENGYTVSRIGKDGNTGKDGVAGKDGVGITSTTITYAGSTSGTTAPTSGWAATVPTVAAGSFLWTRTVWVYTDGTSETGYSVGKMGNTGATGATGAKGATGERGPQGNTGVSVSSVTEYYLATSAATGVTTATTGWSTTMQSMTTSNKYLWNYELINFSDGSTQPTIPVIIGVHGATGGTGSTGATGRSITAISEHYLATNLASGVTRSTSGWTTTMQTTTSDKKYLWNYETITWSSGTTTTYVEPIIIGVHGATGATGAKGDTGPQGATGSQGPKGDTGTSVSSVTEYYLATASSTGVTTSTSGWTTTIQTMTATNKYLWNYEQINFSDGTNQPTLPVIIGAYGDKGQTGSTGATGRSITGITEHYLASNLATGVTRATSGWTTTMQQTDPTKKYLWNYETITWSSGTTTTYVEPIVIGIHGEQGPKGDTGAKGATGSQGPQGNVGTSVTGITEHYLATSASSGVTAATSGWTTSIQTMTATNKYLWNYEKVNFSDGTNQPTVPVIIGVYGDKGATGAAGSTGATGRSITAIQEHYLATSAATGVTRTTSGWSTTMQTTTPTNKYLWNYETITWSSGTTTTYVEPIIIGIHGEQGPQGAKGATGAQGPQGATGTSVSSITEYYLATSASSGVTTSTSGWVTTMPTMTTTNKYLWNYEKVNFSDGTNQPTIPVIIGVHGATGATGGTGATGATGRSITAISEHYLATNLASGVTRTTAGWSTTMQPTTPTNKYLWNYETITWSSGTTTTYVEPIIIGVHGDKGETGAKGDTGAKGATGERGPQGAAGVSVSTITEYYLATASASGVTTATAGWTTTMQPMDTTKKYLWNYELVKFSDNSTQPTIPVIIGVHGATGATGGTGATGRSITGITERYLATSAASGVTRSTSGWTTTMQSTTTTNKYLWNYETITWSSGTTTTYVEPIIIGVHGATGSTGATGAKGATGATGAKGNPGENATARNFLLDSKPSSPITNSSYPIATFLLAEKPVVGEIYTIVIKGQLASTKTAFYAYNSGGSISVASNIVHQGNGLYYKSFNWINSYSSGVTANDTSVVIYPFTSSQTGTSTIEWVSMVKGSVPLTEWVPAHEDLKKGIDELENAVNNTSPTGENLIVNGGFENSKGHQAYGWSPSYELHSVGHSGSKALVWRAHPTTQTLTHLARVPVEPGRTYEYGYWACSSADANGVAGNNKMRLGLSDGNYLSDLGINGAVNNNGSWVKYTREYTIPNDVHEVIVSLNSNNTVGWYKIDDVFMYDITDRKSIDQKADGSATESALNEAAAKLQVLQQEVEAAATSNELKDFIDKYNKDMASRDKDARESESSLSSALASISSIQTNMGDMSATWQFVNRFIKNTPQGIVVGNDSSGSYILIKEDRLAFYSNGQEVAFISQNLMEISRGAFVEQIQIAKYQFEESTTNHLTVRFVG